MVIKILKETVEPEIQKNMPSFLSSIHFEEISLGEVVGQLLQVELLTGEVTVETKIKLPAVDNKTFYLQEINFKTIALAGWRMEKFWGGW